MAGLYTYCGCRPVAGLSFSKWLSALVLGMVIAGAADAQQYSAPESVLTLEQALDIALQDNRTLDNAEMDVGKAADSVAAERTKRLPKLNLGASESYNLTPQSYTYETGTFGPVPTDDVEITSHEGFTTIVSASVKQPLSDLYRIGLTIDNAGSKSPAFVGQASIQANIVDAETNALLAEGADVRVGGYTLSSVSLNSWTDVENIMKFWVTRTTYNLCNARKDTDCVAPANK